MIQRCTNPKRDNYARYGANGISVCEAWRNSFETFYRDIGPRPSPGHTLDRIDNALGYSPENCRWATVVDQGRNTRQNRLLTINGETRTIGEWAEKTGIHYRTLGGRIDRLGWTPEEAITRPIGPQGRRKNGPPPK